MRFYCLMASILPERVYCSWNRRQGPLNEAELRRHIADGTLSATTLVWTEGMAAWTAARDVPDIAALLSGTSQPATDVAATKGKSDAAESVEDAAAWLAGSWHYSGSVPIPNIGQGETDLTQVLSPNGTFTGSGTIRAMVPQINSSSPIDMQLTNTGTWKAERTPKGQLSLSTDSTTTVSAPAVGIPAQTERHSDVTVLEIVDRNTLRDDEGMIWRRRD